MFGSVFSKAGCCKLDILQSIRGHGILLRVSVCSLPLITIIILMLCIVLGNYTIVMFLNARCYCNCVCKRGCEGSLGNANFLCPCVWRVAQGIDIT